MKKFETSKLSETQLIIGGKWSKTGAGEERHGAFIVRWCCDIYNDETRVKVLYGEDKSS